MHDLYCPMTPRDPKWNQGKIPCPEHKNDNCQGCIIYQNETSKRKYDQKKQEVPDDT